MNSTLIKPRIDSPSALMDWLAHPHPGVFLGLDLRDYTDALSARSLQDCAFLGCHLSPLTAELAALQGCLIMPRLEGVPFDAYRPRLYRPEELYDQFDPDDPVASYARCLDWRIYVSFMDPATHRALPSSLEVMLAHRIHDGAITHALSLLLDLPTRLRTVAIMGGHDVARGDPAYVRMAELTQQLAHSGYLILTGGGPGLMEAANLGAYTAGFADPPHALAHAIEGLSAAPLYHHPLWLATAHRVWQGMGPPVDLARAQNIGIPTWFYGHEPPNVFATQIAKYFENSIREEGLLAVALAGVIFGPGNAGTVQEIFQDACQNYYQTYENRRSPMILWGRDFWNPPHASPSSQPTGAKPAFPLLRRLAAERDFDHLILLSDEAAEVMALIRQHSPLPLARSQG